MAYVLCVSFSLLLLLHFKSLLQLVIFFFFWLFLRSFNHTVFMVICVLWWWLKFLNDSIMRVKLVCVRSTNYFISSVKAQKRSLSLTFLTYHITAPLVNSHHLKSSENSTKITSLSHHLLLFLIEICVLSFIFTSHFSLNN